MAAAGLGCPNRRVTQKEIRGKPVIVTGAARGIGRGIAEAFAREDANVVAADLGSLAEKPSANWVYSLAAENDLEQKASKISVAGGVCLALEVDVSDRASCQHLVESAVATFGGLDILVNGAGIIELGHLEDCAESDWDRVFEVNAKGVFLMSQAAIPHMQMNGGVIIIVASSAGKRGNAFSSAYCAAEAAVIGLTQSTAAELAEVSVRVSAICPGPVFTAMQYDYLAKNRLKKYVAQTVEGEFEAFVKDLVPLGRQQTPGEIADAALYLSRAESVTGVSLSVDGGNGIGLS